MYQIMNLSIFQQIYFHSNFYIKLIHEPFYHYNIMANNINQFIILFSCFLLNLDYSFIILTFEGIEFLIIVISLTKNFHYLKFPILLVNYLSNLLYFLKRDLLSILN